MEQPTQFRSAFNGFNREDVVRYMEYTRNKHSAQVAQLTNELEELRARKAPDGSEQAELESRLAGLTVENEVLKKRVAELEQQLSALRTESPSSADELEAYRRAERVERTARERARQIGKTLSVQLEGASVKVSGAADRLTGIAEQLSSQMELIRQAASEGSEAFLEAVSAVDQLNSDLED